MRTETNSPVVTAGVEKHNQTLREAAEATVMALIRSMENERRNINGHEKTKAEAQKKLQELGNSGHSVESVVGATLTGPMADIVKAAVDKANALKKSTVEAQAQDLTRTVHDADSSIAACTKRIGELQAEIKKVEVKQVTATEVLGS